MNAPSPTTDSLDPRIRDLLAQVRKAIRRYVWAEGILAVTVWVLGIYLAAWLVDYLPVLAGASESPRWVRGLFLAVLLGGGAYVAYRYVLRRVLAPLRDASLALLIERRFPALRDALVTTVNLTHAPLEGERYDPQLVQRSRESVFAPLQKVQVRQLFRYAPLYRLSVIGLLILAPLTAVLAYDGEFFLMGLKRLLLLDDAPWPRRAQIELVRIDVVKPALSPTEAPTIRQANLRNGVALVAKGSDVVLRVRADAAKMIPSECTIYYRLDSGERGRVNMSRLGDASGGYQNFLFDGKPLKSLVDSVTFDVVGFDHRLRNLRVEAVDPPSVTGIALDCEFPKYLVDETLGLWLPRTIDTAVGAALPLGSTVRIRGTTSKPLQTVRAIDPASRQEFPLQLTPAAQGRGAFELKLPKLNATTTMEIELIDSDEIPSERPHRLVIEATPDEPPKIDLTLRGIGQAITPDARLPLQGKVTDDHHVGKAWLELAHGDQEGPREPIALPRSGVIDASIDFRARRLESKRPILQPKDRITLVVKAEDLCDLAGEPNQGAAEPIELEVVTADEMLVLLEARELGFRRRFEQIISEMTELQDSLLRLQAELLSDPAEESASTPGGDEAPALTPEQLRERARSLRVLRAQRGGQQAQKSAQETLGVSMGFHDLVQQRENNRLPDAENRVSILRDQIAGPMEQLAKVDFAELDRLLKKVEEQPDEGDAAAAAVRRSGEILAKMTTILEKMVHLEDYNELLDLVRSILKDQQDLQEETRKLQRKKLLEGIEND